MEPHREESQKALPAGAEQGPRRFRIVKLEDRIAPSAGGNTKHCYRSLSGCSPSCVCGTIARCY
jgi:hypothetical protein